MWKRAFPFKICPNTIAMSHMDKPMMKMEKNALHGSPGKATEINYTNATLGVVNWVLRWVNVTDPSKLSLEFRFMLSSTH